MSKDLEVLNPEIGWQLKVLKYMFGMWWPQVQSLAPCDSLTNTEPQCWTIGVLLKEIPNLPSHHEHYLKTPEK